MTTTTHRRTTRRTTRRTARRAGAVTVLTAAAVTLAVPGPAAAETASFKDARGDMGPADTRFGADLHRVKVVNDAKVRIKVTHANLVPDHETGSSLSAFVDADKDRKGPEYVFTGGTFEGSDYGLIKARGWKAQNRRVVDCAHRMDVDYDKDTATLVMARSCLGDPGRIRVEVVTGQFRGTTTDDAVRDWLGERREFSSWVARG